MGSESSALLSEQLSAGVFPPVFCGHAQVGLQQSQKRVANPGVPAAVEIDASVVPSSPSNCGSPALQASATRLPNPTKMCFFTEFMHYPVLQL
jgi:hypothetical protein